MIEALKEIKLNYAFRIYGEVNSPIEDAETTQHPIRPWITIKHKTAYIDGKKKTNEIQTWTNKRNEAISSPDPAVILGYWDKLCKKYLVPDSYELIKQGLIKQMRKPKNHTPRDTTINKRIAGMLNTKSRKQCTYTAGTSYCIHCGECKPSNNAVAMQPKKDKTGITLVYPASKLDKDITGINVAYPHINDFEAFHSDESILFYYNSMKPYKGHDINKIRDNYSIRNPLSKSDNDITVIERLYLPTGEYHDFIIHKGHDYSRIKAFDKEPEFIIHNGKKTCMICGKKLRHNGKYCKSHTRSEINRFNRKISYISNLKHTLDSYTESTRLFTNYNDLNGIDYRKIYNSKSWLQTNYLDIKTSSNMGKTEINRIAGTRNEYRNRTIIAKNKSKYVNLLQNMGFGKIENLYQFNKKQGAENKYKGVKPERFCPHIVKNDHGIYRCDCLNHELVEKFTWNNEIATMKYKRMLDCRNDNTSPLNVTYLKPTYSPSSYTYTGNNLPVIPTLTNDSWLPRLMKEVPEVKTIMAGEYPKCKYHNQPKHPQCLTNKFPYSRYIITHNKLGHLVYYHLNRQEVVPPIHNPNLKAKRIFRRFTEIF